jgi:hypothetical protein
MTDDLGQQALQAFLRDLPDLYRERPGEWVAYRGAERLGFGKEQHLLYQDCLNRGFQLDEFVVFCIEPWETEIVIGPLWADICHSPSSACRFITGSIRHGRRRCRTGPWCCPSC